MKYRNEVIPINLTGMVLKDRYCIVEQIGKGGSGNVYLARDLELGVLWAVKELPITERKEAKILVTLEHHSLPKMVDYEENTQYCYIIMEHISGESLGESLRNGKNFSIKEVIHYGILITQVLGYLHSRKPPVFYGDLKPDNLMLSKSGKLYLVDFGSAAPGYSNQQRVCTGTEGFAAPEQYEGKIGKASDIYALGKTLEILLGKKKKWLFLFCPSLAFLLSKCCRKKETERYLDMETLEKKLQKIQRKMPGGRIKDILAAVTCGLALVLGLVLLFYEERNPDFYEKLTEVTALFYQDAFLQGSEMERKNICKEVERLLQELSRQYQRKEEQRRILQLLALNSEYEGEVEHAALYYEQMILYDGNYRESYGEYGMFLLRIGQKEASGELWEDYIEKNRNGILEEGFSRNLRMWEERMNEEENDRR